MNYLTLTTGDTGTATFKVVEACSDAFRVRFELNIGIHEAWLGVTCLEGKPKQEPKR